MLDFEHYRRRRWHKRREAWAWGAVLALVYAAFVYLTLSAV